MQNIPKYQPLATWAQLLQRFLKRRPATAGRTIRRRNRQDRVVQLQSVVEGQRALHFDLVIALSAPVHQILNAQKRITARLENTTQLERPRNLRRRCEEPEHLHGVTRQPTSQHRQPEALARSRADVRENLRQGQRRFDRESDVAEDDRVNGVQSGERGEDEFERDEDNEKVQQKLPVSVKQPCQ